MNNIQLSIPTPCHEDWNKMTEAEKGRFCSSCQKVVVDFSRMSDTDIIAYFKKPKDSVCGRFYTDQLNRDIIIPSKRIPWLKYFFQIAIPAFLVSFKASSQTRKLQGRVVPKVQVDSIISDKTCGLDIGKALQGRVGDVVVKKIEGKSFTVTGKVTDDKGTPISFASVIIKGTKIGTMADSMGNFSLGVNDHKTTLMVTATTYEAREIMLNGEARLDIALAPSRQMEVGLIVTVKHTKRAKKKQLAEILRKDVPDNKEIKIYPNPSSSGSEITLEWKETIDGDHEIQFISESGVVINKTEVEILNKSSKLDIKVPLLAAGLYIVSITNKKTRAYYTAKLLIK